MSEQIPEEKEKLIAAISEMIGDVPEETRQTQTVYFLEAVAKASGLDAQPFVLACGTALARLGYGPHVQAARQSKMN